MKHSKLKKDNFADRHPTFKKAILRNFDESKVTLTSFFS